MDHFDYPLPQEAIAQEPAEPRPSARMLVAADPTGAIRHATVGDLPEFVGPRDLLVVNNTRVLPARLQLTKHHGGAVEILLLEPAAQGPHPTPPAVMWEALVRRSRRVAPGTTLYAGDQPVLIVRDAIGDEGHRLVELVDRAVPEHYGTVPLPPYIHVPLADPERYQTVYGTNPGAVAAPTAGLHLTEALLDACRNVGASLATVELAVGVGTFRPISAARPEDHQMHEERYRVPEATWVACEKANRVVAVGTTTVRALESVAATGRLEGRSSLFIHGEYPFAVVDVLLTNFHQPRSSLLLLVDAFYGPAWRSRYSEALAAGYRFLSFGDAMLLARGAGR
jgi:S-adenosylmethionine:tRNA ribosyltransferase-isomerase